MLSNCGSGDNSWQSLGQQRDQTSQSQRKSTLNIHCNIDVKAEAPILWPPDAKHRFTGKDPDAGKGWRQEKGMTEDEMVGWHHQLPKLAQTHVHRVSDAIQPFHPLSSPFPAFNLSQHQGLSQGVSSLHLVAKVLEFQLQHQSFQWIFRTDFLKDWLVWSPCSPRDS